MSPIWSRILFLLLVWPPFVWAEDSVVSLRPLYTAEQQAWQPTIVPATVENALGYNAPLS